MYGCGCVNIACVVCFGLRYAVGWCVINSNCIHMYYNLLCVGEFTRNRWLSSTELLYAIPPIASIEKVFLESRYAREKDINSFIISGDCYCRSIGLSLSSSSIFAFFLSFVLLISFRILFYPFYGNTTLFSQALNITIVSGETKYL